MSDRINVLNLRNSIIDGGAEKAILMWYRHIDKSRFNPSLACFANPGGVEAYLTERAERIGLPTYRLPWGRRKRLLAAVRRLTKLIREQNIHVLHSHDAKCDVVALIASRLTGIPVIGVAYAWFRRTSQFRVRFYEWLDVRLLNTFQAIVAISESLRHESVELGINPELIKTVYTGIDYETFQRTPDALSIRRGLGLKADDFVILNLARLWPEKGHTYLLQAMREVIAHNPKAKLLVVGEGPLHSKLEAECNNLGLTDHVVWAGFPENLPDVIRSTDLQVHPSVYEGLPMAILSGMAAGLPVIATNVGGISEVVSDGETGILIPPKDPLHLAKAIVSLIDDSPYAHFLGENAKRLMFQKYRIQAAIRGLEDVYESVYKAHYGGMGEAAAR